MNPSDIFETFDMNTFDDFLARGSFEDEDVSNSSGSSFSDSFELMPIYRSLDVMAPEDLLLDSLCGIDKVFEPPMLSRQSRTSERAAAAPVDDLFALLAADVAHSCVPCVGDLLEGLAQTSVVVVCGLEALSVAMASFLSGRGIQHEHCAATSLWKCELTDFVGTCKFRVQVYREEEAEAELEGCVEYTVEFLRTSGCSLLFSSQFQSYKASQQQQQQQEADFVVSCSLAPELSDVSALAPLDLSSSQCALESLVDWAGADSAQVIGAVSGLLSGQKGAVALMTMTCSDQLSPEGILVMTLLGTLCMQCTSTSTSSPPPSSSSSSLPMLSLLRLLLQLRAQLDLHRTSRTVLTALVDSLVPATARLALAAPSSQAVSACEREAAVQLMESCSL